MNNIRPMNRTPRHIILTALLLLIGSAAMAQNDPQYVITNNGHYLEHVKVGGNWQLRNTDSFNPNCLWYSGNTVDVTGINHNYYFIDLADTSYHFLSAPLEPNGTLGLSASFPGVQLLRNVEQIYYFYNWDMESPGEGGGVARGLQYVGVNDSTSCAHCGNGGSWSAVDNQCWEVYWVEYKTEGTKWELSSASSYGITENSGRFRKVTVQEHLTPVENSGLINLKMNDVASTNFEISWGEEKSLSSTINTPYQYTAYTSYVFGGSTHNYYNETPSGASSDHGSSTPTSTNGQATSVASYEWTLTGDGANYISFNPDVIHSSSNEASPTLYYIRSISTGNKTATLTLTVTYNDGSKQMLTATIKVKVDCQNPGQEDSPIVTYDNVTVTWYNTADRYKIYWTKEEGVWDDANDSIVEGTNSYTFTGLDYNTTYWYKVAAFCNESEDPIVYNFTTQSAPDLMIYGSVFGGGRMADVTGSPTLIIINCDTIGAVFGGNDIAGTVHGANGSKIILGVDADDTYASAYNNNAASTKVRVNDVYGGGNGYYIYNGSSFESASEDTVYIADNAVVQDLMGNVVWTNQTGDVDTLAVPSIVKTAITVTNNQVKIDSLFGGAKNAFLTYDDWHYNGDSIVIQGGTILSVFGGNNVGGGQGKGKHYIKVTGTTTNLDNSISNTATTGFGRDFGIRYLFGGGNKVYGSTTDVYIEGGQLDTIFAGGNSADVYAANITVNCSLEAGTGNTFGHTYSNAFESDTYDGSDIHIKDDYEWDGFSGIYNVRTLFGGNNEASFDSKGYNAVPNITLTSGSVGTVYGGGNAGDMLAHKDGTITLDGDSPINMKHSTKVIMDSPNMLVDYLYGGCQVSNVDYSTWVEIQNGHVGYVYGGCNVSGDVGSTRVNPHAPSTPPNENYQAVQGSTYVKATGGIVYKNLFAGGNGFYHCNDGINYIDSDIDYGDHEGYYIGLSIPTHNETHAIIGERSLIKGNVYAGGNLAPVGFTDFTNVGKPFPAFVGLASVRVEDGTVEGDVYGGGNMAAIQGSNEVRVLGGTIGGALYGGNDRLGEMAQISNRVLPPEYDVASDGYTSLKDLGTRTYVAVSGRPHINTVYGGGNGAYDYSGTDQGGDMDYCNPDDQPIQGFTFVDIHIDGSPDNEHSIPAGHIETVYGGGNGVSVTGSITVFINVQNPNDEEHVGTVFGGNNMGNLELVPDVILLHGNVGTVYGGCNQGAMVGRNNFTIEGATYNDVGSMVHLRKEYVAHNSAAIPTTHTVVPTAKVLNAVYGGCRMNGVQYVDSESHTANTNTLVYVGSGTHPASMFGGSDISGTISGTSHVVVTGGQTGNIYGGGNGNYYYNGNKVYDINDHSTPIDTIATGTITAPVSAVSLVEIMKGNVGDTVANQKADVFGGGLGASTSTLGNVDVIIGTDTATAVAYTPLIYGDIYGGSALGTVNTNSSDTTTVDILNGTIIGDIYGGGLGRKGSTEPAVDPVEAKNFGKVYVNIGKSDSYNCFLDLRETNVFGCNNANGSPQDSVTVNVYKTAHSYATYTGGVGPDNYSANYAGNNPQYSIRQVFGGGNEADYAPEAGSTSSTRLTTVNVFTCYNTIGRTFGGGNAATVHKAASYIYGGRFHQVFGGGNGTADIPANIGSGGASLNVYNGNILQLFGGNNLNGEITGPMAVNVTNDGTCNENIVEFFGGSNKAVMGSTTPVNLVTTIDCGAEPVRISTVYGGSNLAAIAGDVTLNIKGGEYTNVFGGSKGAVGTAANIDGKVTLNLYGGTLINAFGGSNINGNITDTITVNVLDYENNDCPLDVTNIFGASNETAYEPDSIIVNGVKQTPISPIVNVMNIKQTNGVRGNVFGGGNLASVKANPRVNIGYNAADMADYVPSDFTKPVEDYRAFVDGNVFGGGNMAAVIGSDTVMLRHANSRVDTIFGGGNMDGVTNSTVNILGGKVATAVYGGCNTEGTVTGDVAVNILNNLGATGEGAYNVNVFGGGLGEDTETHGNVTVTIGTEAGGNTSPVIYGQVYGGSAMGSVNDGDDDVTQVWLRSGKVNGRLYGGGLGLLDPGVDTIAAKVYGGVQVLVDDGEVTMAVYGCNDQYGAPQDTVNVKINGGKVANVVGGGNLASYEAPSGKLNYPYVHITGGEVTNKIIGGGNAANVVGNPHILISGGTLCIGADEGKGIYGGCNAEGTVDGNTNVTLTGGTIGVSDNNTANIHGGGYGQPTSVTGNVTVNFGTDNDIHNDAPTLYGELYGGSALGSVNSDRDDITTVSVYNGTINGHVFGGGLGDDADLGDGHTNVAALVNGRVQVNIGKMIPPVEPATEPTFSGQAILNNCDVYGCNNIKGSPQDEVKVDVYKTYLRETDSVDYTTLGATYGISSVFGGGNKAHYAPSGSHRTHLYVHGCDNTSEFLYAGGNAADALGVEIVVEGGRFREAYGGGNGMVTPANIGVGGIGFNFHGGHYNYTYEGSNRLGDNAGGIYTPDLLPEGQFVECGGQFTESHFFGANEAEIYVDVLENTITCAEADNYHYTNVYAGSRWAIIYGDVKLTVGGGNILNLFGGSQGYNPTQSTDARSADIRRYPTRDEVKADTLLPQNERKYSAALIAHMDETSYASAGKGGNVTLVVNGGTIGNVIGGCDVRGNVEGQITVVIADSEESSCPLNLGNVYGGSNMASYAPINFTAPTPKVEILKGTLGMEYDFNGNSTIDVGERFEGNAFGGGNFGEVISNPIVIVGDGTTGALATPVNINGNVFGGGNEGDVIGSSQVVLVPNSDTITIIQPDHGTITVIEMTGDTIASKAIVGENVDLNIVATPEPATSAGGYVLSEWRYSGEGASVNNTSRPKTTFTMGTGEATLEATFVSVPAHQLRIADPEAHGTFLIDGTPYSSPVWIAEGATVTVKAIPENGFVFSHWTISGEGASVNHESLATVTFTMGSEDATMTASFNNDGRSGRKTKK